MAEERIAGMLVNVIWEIILISEKDEKDWVDTAYLFKLLRELDKYNS